MSIFNISVADWVDTHTVLSYHGEIYYFSTEIAIIYMQICYLPLLGYFLLVAEVKQFLKTTLLADQLITIPLLADLLFFKPMAYLLATH